MSISKYQRTEEGMRTWRERYETEHPVMVIGDVGTAPKTLSYHSTRADALEWVRNNPYTKWEYQNLRIVNRNKSVFYV